MPKPMLAALAVPLATAAVLSAAALVTREPGTALASEGMRATNTVTPGRAGAAEVEGTWTITPREDGRLQLNLHYETSNWGRGIDRADLQGLSDAAVESHT